MAADTAAPTVGDALEALLEDQIAFERTKKASLEARGLAVITTAGTLVTLLLALAAVITKSNAYTAPFGARILLIVAVVVFLFAAILGIYCNAPLSHQEVEPESLRTLTAPDDWGRSGIEARREIAEVRLTTLADSRDVNQTKAIVLAIAGAVEVLAVVLTGAAAAVILAQG